MKKALTVLGLGALAALFSLPVITLGGAASALYYSLAKCVRRGRERPWREFFRAFRQNFATGAALSLILALLLAVAYVSALYLVNAPLSALVTAFYAVTLSLTLFFALDICALGFPALSRFSFRAAQILSFTLRLLRRAPWRALALMLLAAATMFAAYLFPPAALILAGPAGYLATLLAGPVLNAFTPPREEFPATFDYWF